MRHSITFWEDIATAETAKNTWKNWGLVPYQQPVFSTPKQKTTYIQLAGADGSIDLSTAITGYPLFQNRTGRFEFIYVGDWGRWLTIFDEIKDFLHGQRIIATLEDEPDWCYEGRFAVDNMYTDEQHGTIAISYEVDPYKKAITRTTEPWLWNPFSFEHGVVGSGTFYYTPIVETPQITAGGAWRMTIPVDIPDGTDFKFTFSAPVESFGLGVTVNGTTVKLIDGAEGEPGEEYEFTADGDYTMLHINVPAASISADCTAQIDVEFPNPVISTNASAFTNLEITATASEFDLQNTGNMPGTVTFTAHDNAVTLTITQGSQSVTESITAGTSKTIKGLVLYKNAWLYNGKPATVTANTASGTAYLDMDFRIGVL